MQGHPQMPESGSTSDAPTPEQPTSHETLASIVHHKVLADILRGRLKPGRKLRVDTLKENYRVGGTPIREALSRLTDHGLVVYQDQKGFQVAGASVEELLEIIRTRCWLEEIAIRESIRHGDESWKHRVGQAHYRLSRTPRPTGESLLENRLEWERHHREFHLALISACSSTILVGYCAELQARTFRYQNLSSVRAYRRRLPVDEHGAIRKAALERDADRAVELLTAHYRATGGIAASI